MEENKNPRTQTRKYMFAQQSDHNLCRLIPEDLIKGNTGIRMTKQVCDKHYCPLFGKTSNQIWVKNKCLGWLSCTSGQKTPLSAIDSQPQSECVPCRQPFTVLYVGTVIIIQNHTCALQRPFYKLQPLSWPFQVNPYEGKCVTHHCFKKKKRCPTIMLVNGSKFKP